MPPGLNAHPRQDQIKAQLRRFSALPDDSLAQLAAELERWWRGEGARLVSELHRVLPEMHQVDILGAPLAGELLQLTLAARLAFDERQDEQIAAMQAACQRAAHSAIVDELLRRPLVVLASPDPRQRPAWLEPWQALYDGLRAETRRLLVSLAVL